MNDKEQRKPDRSTGVDYVWPQFEKELYSICAQRKCTLQRDGKMKNLSENFLMREQFSQNSRKRKDKRIKEENNGSDQTESNGKENMVKMNSQKKSKQNRRLLHNKDVTPTRGIPPTSDDNKNNLVKKKGTNESFEGESCREPSTRRHLDYMSTGNNLDFKDNCNNDNNKRNLENSAEEFVKQSEAGVKRQKTALDDVTTRDENHEDSEGFSAGQLIWGKLKGFDWWPGMVVELKNISLSQTHARPNEVWVKWFGDNKYSKLAKNDLVPLRHFASKFLPQKFRGTYKRAVLSALEVAVSRCNKEFTIDSKEENEKPNKEERAKLLIDWALKDFQPTGPEGFEVIKEDYKLTINTNTVVSEAEWNQRDGKERFGQPIQTPALAEDVKAVFDQAKSGIISIDDICLGCGDTKISVPHPLFHGSLCNECKETFLECAYLFDEDGYQVECASFKSQKNKG